MTQWLFIMSNAASALADWLAGCRGWPLCMLIYVRCSFILPSFEEHVIVFASFWLCIFYIRFSFHCCLIEWIYCSCCYCCCFWPSVNCVRSYICMCLCWKCQWIEFPMTVSQRRQLNIHTKQLSILELRLKCKFIFKKSKLLHVFIFVLKSTPQTHTHKHTINDKHTKPNTRSNNKIKMREK